MISFQTASWISFIFDMGNEMMFLEKEDKGTKREFFNDFHMESEPPSKFKFIDQDPIPKKELEIIIEEENKVNVNSPFKKRKNKSFPLF